MINNIYIVLWKEFKSILCILKSFEYRISNIILVLLFYILLLKNEEKIFIHENNIFIFYLGVIFISNIQISISSFASERENKNLETLLSSRLQETELLFGKLICYTIYSLAHIFLFCSILFIISKTIMNPDSSSIFHLSFSSAGNIIIFIVTCIVGSFASSSLGIYLSIKSADMEEAQSAMRKCILLFFFPISILYALIEKTHMQLVQEAIYKDAFFKLIITFYCILTIFSFLLMVKRFNKLKSYL